MNNKKLDYINGDFKSLSINLGSTFRELNEQQVVARTGGRHKQNPEIWSMKQVVHILCLRPWSCCSWAQKRSFLKKKPTWLVLSLLGAGLLYLQAKLLIIIFNISLAKVHRSPRQDNLLLIEELSEFSLHLLSGFFAAQLVLVDDVLKIDAVGCNHVSSGHNVVVVHSLHERLHLRASLDLLLAHVACDLQGVSLNAGNEGVSELLVLHNQGD